MILGASQTQIDAGDRATLDGLFRRAVARRPDAIALADPPDRARFTDGAPRRLTYAEADRIVTGIAARLRRLELTTDAVVALQLPNTVEGVLSLLGILRAGMIAAPLPLLWRRADMITALGQIGAKAIVASSRVGGNDHCELAMQVAAEIFPIRYVCGFGERLADGVIGFDDLLAGREPEPLPPAPREGNPAAHVALVTWDVTPDGPVAVARNHIELLAGGLAILLEGGLAQDAVILSPVPPSSFAGVALALLPWLLTGGTLALHQPFDPDLFAEQCASEGCDTVVLPGALAPRLAELGLLDHAGLRNVLALWRAPERLTAAPAWRHPHAGLIDVLAFGEAALIGACRRADGRPAPVVVGGVTAPRDAAGAVLVAELTRSEAGTVAVRGPMVPRHSFPPGSERSATPRLKADADGWVDAGHTCRIDHETQAMVVTGPPPGMVSVGGYRFALRDLQDLAERAEPRAAVAALPDIFAGYRLAGHAVDRDAVQAVLASEGTNPLIAGAFRERRKPDAA